MGRKKKLNRGTYTYGTAEVIDRGYVSGDAFYLKDNLFKEFFLGSEDDNTLLEHILLRRKLAFRAAEDSGNHIIDVKIEMVPDKDRVEIIYEYEDKECAD